MTDLKILIVNANGNGEAPQRRENTAEVVDNVQSDIIFFQEFENADWTEREFANYESCVHSYNVKEASIVTRLPNKPPDMALIRKLYADTIQDEVNEYRNSRRTAGTDIPHFELSRLDIPYFELSRLAFCVCDKGWLCVSWHGRFSGFAVKSKQVALRTLLLFLIRLQREVKKPFILGADFNIESAKVREVVWEFREHGLKLYDADDKEKVMVIVSGEITALHGPIIHGEEGRMILDHLQIELTLHKSKKSISTTLEYVIASSESSESDSSESSESDSSESSESDSSESIRRLLRLEVIHMVGALQRFTSMVREGLSVCEGPSTVVKKGKRFCRETSKITSSFLQKLLDSTSDRPDENRERAVRNEEERLNSALNQISEIWIPRKHKLKSVTRKITKIVCDLYFSFLRESIRSIEENVFRPYNGDKIDDFYLRHVVSELAIIRRVP